MKTILSHCAEETEEAGFRLASLLVSEENPCRDEENTVVAFYGDLGAGKTAFIRGMARCVAPNAYVSSPTFALMNEYVGKTHTICHYDMYRITDEDDLVSIGYYDLTGKIIAMEWSENVPYALPRHYIRVTVKRLDQDAVDPEAVTVGEREIVIEEINETEGNV